jgi:hypothetical protein
MSERERAKETQPSNPAPDDAESDLVELILAQHAPADAEEPVAPCPPARIDGVVVGTLVALGEGGEPLVDYPGNPVSAPLEARSTVALSNDDIGREVALLFERGDPERPLVMGRMHVPAPTPALAISPAEAATVTRDGEKLVFSAESEIVLQCGKASITLTKAGKILIRGAYLLARSTGVNRIQGGSVQIN